MACIEQKRCECGRAFTGVVGGIDQCNECINIVETVKRENHFGRLDRLSMEERIREIEEWIYNYSPPVHPGDIKY